MTNFDAIVIGAGNGGLTAATKLQRSGQRTLLLERHNIPGGCATSFVRGDFEFEVALHQLSGMGTPEQPFVLRNLFSDLGVMEKVDFIEEGELYRLMIPGELDVTLPADWDGLRAVVKDEFPAEAEAIDQFLDICEALTVESFLMLPTAVKQDDEEGFRKACPYYVKYGLKTSKEVFDQFFTDKKIMAVLGAYWGYLGLPISQLPFRDMAALIWAYSTFKPYHIVGGSQALSSALLDSFLEAGGEVKFNCPAAKILTTDGAVRGVRTEAGDEYSCTNIVSNASSIITYNELLDNQPGVEQAQQNFKSCRIGTSGFVIYLGLDCPPEELGVTTATNFFAASMDDDAAYDRSRNLDAPLGGVLTCYNFDDPSFAPPGKSHVALMCLQHGSAWDDIAPEDYAKTKYAFAEKLIDLAEVSFPNIRDHIEEMEAATPRTMMRYLNTPQGAIYGFDQDMYETPLLRNHTPEIEGLYLAGCWIGMGGFQPSYLAGEKAARSIIENSMTRGREEEQSHVG